MAIGFFGAVWQTTLQQHVPEEALSRVSAWDWMGSFAFMPLGFVLAGPVSDQSSGSRRRSGSAVVWCALSTAVLLALPEIRNLRRRIDAPEPLPSGPIPDPAVVAGRPEPWT